MNSTTPREIFPDHISSFTYDSRANLGFGKVVKTKNGIIVKSFYPESISKYYKLWNNVIIVDSCDELTRPVLIQITPNSDTTIVKNDNKDETPSYIVSGSDMAHCLNVCIFHGFSDIIAPKEFTFDHLREYQKKLFHKIYICPI